MNISQESFIEPPNEQSQAILTPRDAIELLKAGNQRFLDQRQFSKDFKRQIQLTADGQYPMAVILSCIDSRIPIGIVFDQGIGHLFNVCVAGNVLNNDVLGSMEFACKLAGAKLVVVMGHTSCGAVKGACDEAKLGHITQLLDKVAPAVIATETKPGEDRTSSNKDFVNRVALKSVELTIARIQSESSVLREMEEGGDIDIVGAMYDVASGRVSFFD